MGNGRDTERDCVAALEELGHETYQPPKAKYREQDVFGLFDVLAFGHGRLVGIQIKGGRDATGINGWFEQATAYSNELRDVEVQFWHRKDGAWRIAEPKVNGWEWAFDGRDERTREYSTFEDAVTPTR